jgi:hypothetical protein
LVLDVPDELNVLVQARQVGYTVTLEEDLARTDFGSDLKGLKARLSQLLKHKQAAIADKALIFREGPGREAFKAAQFKRIGVKIQGDSQLKWHSVVEVMDTCRQAGFAKVSFAAPPDIALGRQ